MTTMHPRTGAPKSPETPLDDPVSDANMAAIIAQQRTLISNQMVEVAYLNSEVGLTPPPPGTQPVPPVSSDLAAISDTLAGASRALGAYISQLNTLIVLWPPASLLGEPAAPPVNGNGGSP
jgi:hypothetical protein